VTRIYELYHMAQHAYLKIQPAVKTGQPLMSKNNFLKGMQRYKILYLT